MKPEEIVSYANYQELSQELNTLFDRLDKLGVQYLCAVSHPDIGGYFHNHNQTPVLTMGLLTGMRLELEMKFNQRMLTMQTRALQEETQKKIVQA